MNLTKLFSETLIRNGIISRSYYTNRVTKATLYSMISPLGNKESMEPVLEDWLKNGSKIRFDEIQRIIRDLRKRRRYSHALQVSEWMQKKGLFAISSSNHAVHLDLIGRVRGFLSAESHFNNLSDQYKDNKTYGSLLNCYVRQRQIDKSLSHMQKMKELGFASSALAYNDMMCLYLNIGQYEKIPDVLSEMKENGVSPDNFSYRICINSYVERSDIEGMERVLREMENQPHIVMDWNAYATVAYLYIKAGLTSKAIGALKQAETRLEKNDGTGYNHLISLYASLGNKAEVWRLWELEKRDCKRYINKDYINMLRSLVKLGELQEAETLLKEWESSGNCYDFRVPEPVISGYSTEGLYEKAQAILEDLMEKGKITNPKSWDIVAAGYLDKGEAKKALECMKAALALYEEDKGWKPNPRVINGILSWLGDKGTVEDAEVFVVSLRAVIPVNRAIYHALMKAFIRSGKELEGLLDSMKADQIDDDEETKKILAARQN